MTQDGAARVATRGDQVMCSIDVLERTQVSARVKSVEGRLIELDELFYMQATRAMAFGFGSSQTAVTRSDQHRHAAADQCR